MLELVLINSLKPHHRAGDLYLSEGEDFIRLYKKGYDKPIATWGAFTVTIDQIWAAADTALGI